MCVITDFINASCGTNPAGLAAIAIFNKKDIDTIPAADAQTGIVSTNITMKANKKGWNLPFTEETAEFDEPLDGEIDAQTFKPLVKFSVAGRVPATIKQINSMVGGRYVLVVTFLDGTKAIVGSLITPLRLRKADFKSGAYGSNARKGFEFEFNGSSATSAFPYSGVLDATIVNFQ